MFCSACGSEVAEGLKFCNRCGAGLGPDAPPRVFAMIVILSLSFAVVTGLGLFFVLIITTEYMSRRDANAATFVFIALLILLIFALGALMVRQISRLLTVYLQAPKSKAANPESPATTKTSTPDLASTQAAETLPLYTNDRSTSKVPADTDEQELPTRRL